MKQRKIASVTSSPLHKGFLGEGHLAAAVIDGTDYTATDPFMLLMDDRLNLPGGPPVGGPHPHAGFETVTLVLEGNEKEWKTGSLELMTAGKGIIHTEEITSEQKLRILQLWLVLPPEKRWAEPFHQLIPAEQVPTLKTPSHEIRVYSGNSNGLTSPLQNNTAFTLVDFKLEPGADANQQLPGDYTTMIYVIDGSVTIAGQKAEQGNAIWLDKTTDPDESEITFTAGEHGARFVLYAGRPHRAPVTHYGPFIGNNQDDIVRLYKEYREGKMPHLNDLPASRKLKHTA